MMITLKQIEPNSNVASGDSNESNLILNIYLNCFMYLAFSYVIDKNSRQKFKNSKLKSLLLSNLILNLIKHKSSSLSYLPVY